VVGFNPVLDLPLSEGAGTTVYDRSGWNNHGTIYGATWEKHWRDWLLNHDAYDDYFETPYSAVLQPDSITIVYWLKLTVDPDVDPENNWRWLLNPQGWRAPCFNILEQNRTINFTVRVGGTNYRLIGGVFSGETLPLNEWAFRAYVYDHKTGYGYAYTEAGLSRTGVMVDGGGALDKSAYGWRFSYPAGTYYPVGNGAFGGFCGELRIFGTVLSADQIAFLATLFRGERRSPPSF